MTLLRMQPGNVELPVHDNESILDAIVRGGYTCRYGCRRGGCGQCKADLVSGEVEYRKKVADSVLSEEERASGVVLTCRAHPISDEVELQMRHTEKFKLFVPLAYAMGQVEVAAQKLNAAGIHISLEVHSKPTKENPPWR